MDGYVYMDVDLPTNTLFLTSENISRATPSPSRSPSRRWNMRRGVHTLGIEPRAQAWKACMLPLHYECRDNHSVQHRGPRVLKRLLHYGSRLCSERGSIGYVGPPPCVCVCVAPPWHVSRRTPAVNPKMRLSRAKAQGVARLKYSTLVF